MKNHKQFNSFLLLRDKINNSPREDFELKQANVLKTDKDLRIKEVFTVTDNETANKKGQRFNRTPFLTTAGSAIYSVAAQDFLIGITGLAGAPTIGLPLPSLIGPNKHYIVKDEAGGAATTTITVVSAGEKTIDGASSSTLTTNYQAKEFYTDGANWFTK